MNAAVHKSTAKARMGPSIGRQLLAAISWQAGSQAAEGQSEIRKDGGWEDLEKCAQSQKWL